MDNILLEGVWYGVRAVHYRQGKQFRVRYTRSRDGKYISDEPIKGLNEPWTEETLRYSVTRLFAFHWENKRDKAWSKGMVLHQFFFDFDEGVIKYG